MKSLSAICLTAILTGATALASIDSGLLSLVMPDAKALSGLQIDQASNTPFGQYILSQFQPNDPGFLKFMAATGFDPRHDLHEVLAATSTGSTGLLLGRGTFNIPQITSAATSQGGTVSTYKTATIVSGAEHNSAVVAFLDANTLAMGDLASVQAAIDRRGSSNSIDPTLLKKAQDASVNQAWFATTSPLSSFLNGKLANPNLNNISQNNLFQNIVQASGGINFKSGVVITADAATSSTQNAQAIVDVLKFLVSLVPVDNPTLKSLADTATFAANGSTAHMVLSLSEQQAEQLFTSMPHSTAAARRN